MVYAAVLNLRSGPGRIKTGIIETMKPDFNITTRLAEIDAGKPLEAGSPELLLFGECWEKFLRSKQTAADKAEFQRCAGAPVPK